MKHTIKSIIAAIVVGTIAIPAAAQNVQRPYVQVDVGGAQPSGNLGSQISLGLRGGLEFNKYLSGELSLSENIMSPATWLGGFNTTEFKATPYLRYPITDKLTVFAGPQLGVAMISGAASTNTPVGTYGGTGGFQLNTNYHNFSLVAQYEYVRSMQPVIITGPGYTDYYNNNKITMGLRKTF